MTYAPSDSLAIRREYMALTGTPGDSVGIVPDEAHRRDGGYHCGNDDLAAIGRLLTDYSKRESERDRPGTNGGAAIDFGLNWSTAAGGRNAALAFNRKLAADFLAGDPRLRDLREVIYTPDGRTVQRVDKLGKRSTGDSSHLYHTHLSFFRDSEGRRNADDNFGGWMRAYFGRKSSSTESDDMTQVLIRNTATNELFIADGMQRRPVKAAWVGTGAGPITNVQVHQAGLLGNLGNGGKVFDTSGDMDVWGVLLVDQAGLKAALDPVFTQLDRIEAALTGAEGNPDNAPVLAAIAELRAKLAAAAAAGGAAEAAAINAE